MLNAINLPKAHKYFLNNRGAPFIVFLVFSAMVWRVEGNFFTSHKYNLKNLLLGLFNLNQHNAAPSDFLDCFDKAEVSMYG